jgi:hypothetical protein
LCWESLERRNVVGRFLRMEEVRQQV